MADASTFADLQTYVPLGGTITLLNDITMTSTISIPATTSATIEGAGFTLSNTSSRHFNLVGDGSGTGGGASLTLENVILDGGSASGGINIGGSPAGGTLILNEGAVIQNCRTSGNGGGIYALEGSSITLNSGSILQNNYASASNGGGAIYISAQPNYQILSTLTINEGSLITDNSVPPNSSVNVGGAISGFGGHVITINGGTISNNTAYSGGGISMRNYQSVSSPLPTRLNMTNGLLTGNKALRNNSGALRLFGSTPIATNQTVEAYLSGGEISSNTAQGSGGGIGFTSITGSVLIPYLNLSGSILISNNLANINGGGIGSDGASPGILDFQGGIISENTAINNGGGVCLLGDSTINQTGGTISNNFANLGGGIYCG